MKNIITISREYGSGGTEIGHLLEKRLGYKYYDKQLISGLAENLMIPENMIRQAENSPAKKNIFHEAISFWTKGANDQDKYIFEEQGKFIRKLAENGNCIFAGRRADYYLKDNENAFHLFFYAPAEKRIKHIMETENLSEEEAVKKIESMDKMRKSSYEYVTGRTWGDRHNFDRMINTDSCSIEQIVEEIAMLIEGSDR